jgi:hypothetical protein
MVPEMSDEQFQKSFADQFEQQSPDGELVVGFVAIVQTMTPEGQKRCALVASQDADPWQMQGWLHFALHSTDWTHYLDAGED